MALTDKTRKVNIILTLGGVDNALFPKISEDIPSVLNDLDVVQYAYILHEKDVKEDGTLKTPHFHICAEFSSARRLATYLSKVAAGLGLNTLSVSVDKCRSFEGSLQYLVHKNDPDKYQYSTDDVHTNINEENFKLYMSADPEELTIDRLIYLCNQYKKPIEVAKIIGLGRYQVYRKVISDIFCYLHSGRFS